LCHNCAGYPCTEEADALCKELGEIGCCGMIWKEVDVTEEMGAEDE